MLPSYPRTAKNIKLAYRFVKIGYAFNKKSVYVVFLICLMRQCSHKFGRLTRTPKLACYFSQLRHSDAEDPFRINGRYQRTLKFFIFFIHKCVKSFADKRK